jgi:hypothetical protein
MQVVLSRDSVDHGQIEQEEGCTMPSDYDASIKLLDAVDLGTFFSIDDVAVGQTFDVVANVEIGQDLNQVVTRFDLRVAIRNLTQSKTVAIVNDGGALAPGNAPFLDQRRVNIAAGWDNAGNDAVAGDVLQALASYKVSAGVNFDFSTAQSNTFLAS